MPCVVRGKAWAAYNFWDWEKNCFDQSNTAIGLFFSKTLVCDTSLVFLDSRFHFLNNGQWSLNVGPGYRSISEGGHIRGMNFFYDLYKVQGKNLSRIGLGLEYLSPSWDLRLNGYLPLGDKLLSRKKTVVYPGGFVAVRRKEIPMAWGADAELLKRCWSSSLLYWYAGIGPYYYGHSKFSPVVGGKIRFGCNFHEWLIIEGQVFYDKIWKTRYHAQIRLELPLQVVYRSNSDCCCYNPIYALIQQLVERIDLPLIPRQCCWKTNF